MSLMFQFPPLPEKWGFRMLILLHIYHTVVLKNIIVVALFVILVTLWCFVSAPRSRSRSHGRPIQFISSLSEMKNSKSYI
mmetsp:Transcript_19073/g.24545  ORF Transcript_19073/g.24545 Transcript_19073/m.24545 type:complete len:80 (+) Transcript_19073:130-369(+)